jgi:formate-dependent nitrite reductase cytochrome c552 subunit
MDPMIRVWLYESWIADLQDKHQFTKDYTILGGSFHNPEAARQMIQSENPSIVSTDEEYEASTQMVLEAGKLDKEMQSAIHRRRKRQIRKVINKEG